MFVAQTPRRQIHLPLWRAHRKDGHRLTSRNRTATTRTRAGMSFMPCTPCGWLLRLNLHRRTGKTVKEARRDSDGFEDFEELVVANESSPRSTRRVSETSRKSYAPDPDDSDDDIDMSIVQEGAYAWLRHAKLPLYYSSANLSPLEPEPYPSPPARYIAPIPREQSLTVSLSFTYPSPHISLFLSSVSPSTLQRTA